ncbi:helix-turn-helix domain-containing protein [Pseudomonas fragi]|nr:helix-turn-helix domain-containing protein [Pseudomonas fragi]NNB37891.1 helix-turn-helix domain-containing protein [Pseudomonas fragi]
MQELKVKDLSQAVIARQLGVSGATVSRHLRRHSEGLSGLKILELLEGWSYPSCASANSGRARPALPHRTSPAA